MRRGGASLCSKEEDDVDEFRLGIPSLVCRWRLANGKLPLQSRHIRALGARRIDGKALSPALIAWVKQRVEWGLEGTNAHPDGVLMLVIDEEGKSALSLGPYRPLKGVSANDLLERAIESRREGLNTGVAPEELWLVRDDTLIWATSGEFAPEVRFHSSMIWPDPWVCQYAVTKTCSKRSRVRVGPTVRFSWHPMNMALYRHPTIAACVPASSPKATLSCCRASEMAASEG